MSSIKSWKTLNTTKEFNRVYKKPTHTWHTKEFVLFYAKSDLQRVAFIASKKVGKAVLRNRAKRLLKAIFIEYSSSLKSGTYIFVAKKDILDSNFLRLKKNFKYIIKRLNLSL